MKNHHHSLQPSHPQSCPHCGKDIKDLKRHVKDVHGEKDLCVCTQCTRSFLGMAQLRAHMKHTHDNVGQKFVCHICSKEVANELNLKHYLRRQHLKARKPEESLPCPECGKTFAFKIQLNCHHKAVHEVDQRK